MPIRKPRFAVTYPTDQQQPATITTRAANAHDPIRRGRLAGFPAPAGRTVDLNAEPEVQLLGRGGTVHAYGPRYGGW